MTPNTKHNNMMLSSCVTNDDFTQQINAVSVEGSNNFVHVIITVECRH